MRSIYFALATGLAILITTPAGADQFLMSVQSYHPNIVSLEFYSQNYNRSWLGDGDVYLLKDSEVHEYNLSCETGETICYGAWVRGQSESYWGVGMNDSNRCTSCCFVCGDGYSKVQVLNP